MRRSQHMGLHRHRLRGSRVERAFAKAWDAFAPANLDYLLWDSDTRYPPAASPRDRAVAATIIQWLGSDVGQGFLRQLGYERVTPPAPAGGAS